MGKERETQNVKVMEVSNRKKQFSLYLAAHLIIYGPCRQETREKKAEEDRRTLQL